MAGVMPNLSIERVRADRVELTAQPERGWKTQAPYTYVFPSVLEAIDNLPALYRALWEANT